MPVANAIDPLKTYREGVRDTHGRPIPLTSTAIDIAVEACFATVCTRRVFRNAEDASIEATMTFPVPVDAVAHDLRVEIDGRVLAGHAEPKAQARETYEAALDAGKPAVLHEEALKGVHVLSIAHIPPGKEVAVEIGWSKPLSLYAPSPSLRIPTTVAEIYGRLPLLPADDILVHESHVFAATLSVRVDGGSARLGDRTLEPGASIEVPLDRPIDLAFPGLAARELQGKTADGRCVSLAIARDHGGDGALRLGILFDRSGSTGSTLDGGSTAVWQAAMAGLKAALKGVRADDAFEVWQFDSDVEHLGREKGSKVTRLLDRVGGPRGGTEAGAALQAATRCEAITDVLFVTDGRTGAIPVQAFAACGKRVSAVLCGANSLDAMIGHLCALTGGQIVVAASDNITAAVEATVAGARRPLAPLPSAAATSLPPSLEVVRGGARVVARWSGEPTGASEPDAIGAYAAALALPMLREEAATRVAVAHGLCTHLTSLVIVDEVAEAQEGVPNQRKVPLSRPMEAERGGVDYMLAGAAAPMVPRSRRAAPAVGAPQAPAAAPLPPMAAPYPTARAAAAPPPPAAAPPTAPAPASSGSRPFGVPILPRLAAEIDWDADANALSKGEITGISVNERHVLDEAASEPTIARLAKKAGVSPVALVLALLAASLRHTRGAARIARQVLSKLSKGEIAEAMALLGL